MSVFPSLTGGDETEFAIGCAKNCAECLAVTLVRPSDNAALVASDGAGIKVTALLVGTPQIVVDRFRKFGATHRTPRLNP
ncbi:hypothetical protein ACQPW1_31210 [Nocardia sp. CA-128927]|uniref:hypothetical protein n=1 Tax=Nocardia sp. CA-128927 TaxID=3239975 RepID=UPI003D97211B